MKYIIFITRNKEAKINGINRIYVGVHKTENPEIFDGYLGDGVKIQQANSFMYPKSPFQCAVKKYGVNAFERITLFVFNTPEEAYSKERDIVTEDFIKSPFTYNVFEERRDTPIYQFNLDGKLIKKWESLEDCCDFYNYPSYRFKGFLLNSYWSTSTKIDLTKRSNTIYLYSKEGKLLKMLDKEYKEVSNEIKNQTLVENQYYISNKLTDQFIPKPRRQYINQTFNVYLKDAFLGSFKGKDVMKVINLHSWTKISNIFEKNNGWYKDYYISLEKVKKLPIKESKTLSVDVYDKYGNFIEHINSIKEVKEKYQIPAAKIKNIQQGNKYFNDYIFKYSK